MDFWDGFWFWTLVYSTVCSALSFKLAEVKGHDKGEWALFGFVFGLLGLLAAVGLPDHHNAPDASTEPCPACGGTLAKGYRKCRYCSESLMWHEGTPYSGSESEVRKQLSELAELAEAKRQQLQEETDERQRLEAERAKERGEIRSHIESERSHFREADSRALLSAAGLTIIMLTFFIVTVPVDVVLVVVGFGCSGLMVAVYNLDSELADGAVRGYCRWRNMFRRKLMGSDRLPNSTEPKQDPTSDESNHAG